MRGRAHDGMIAAVFFLVAVGLRVPFRSEWAYHWDSAQFALAIREYNVALSQPHAPGYFLYVLLGRLVNLVVADPHASLVWLSVLFGSALPAALFGLGTTLFGRRAGIAAGLFGLTCPQVWFHSCVAVTYVVDAFLVCVTVWYAWYAMQQGGRWRDAVVIGLLVAVIGGVRQQTVPLLCPLLAYVFWNFKSQRLAKLVVAALVAVALGALWFWPMVAMSGGWEVYRDVLRRHALNNVPVTFAGGGWRALYTNCYLVVVHCWNGLLLGTALLVGAVLYRVGRMPAERKRAWDAAHRRAGWLLAWWIVPMMLFGTVIGFTAQPGYVLSYLPAWLLLCGLVAGQLTTAHRFAAVTGAVALVNGSVFVIWPAEWDTVLLGYGRTAREIRQHDRQLAAAVAAIRARYDPAHTVLCHALPAHYDFGFRHFQWHLPEFEQYQLAVDPTIPSPANHPLWRAREGRLEFARDVEEAGQKRMLLVVPPGLDVEIYRRHFTLLRTRALEGTDGIVRELER